MIGIAAGMPNALVCRKAMTQVQTIWNLSFTCLKEESVSLLFFVVHIHPAIAGPIQVAFELPAVRFRDLANQIQ